MSTRRDPDQRLAAFLDEGPEVLPDRVLEALQDDVHRMRQRAGIGSWRFFTVRTYVAAAAVVLIVLAGGGILWAARPPSVTNQPSATPSTVPSQVPSDPPMTGTLTAGQQYHHAAFGEPLSLTLPSGFGNDVIADIWDTQSFRLDDPSSGVITIHDDVRLPNNLCRPTGVTADVPGLGTDAIGSVEGVGAWLEGMDGLTVTEGRWIATPDNAGYIRLGAAKYWDIELGPDCYVGDEAPPGDPVVWFQAGERHRVYGVATDSRDDAIIVFTWGTGSRGEGDEVLETLNRLTDGLVSSFDFDGPTFAYP